MGKHYHVEITCVVVYVTQDLVEVVPGKGKDIARVARQVNHFLFCACLCVCSLQAMFYLALKMFLYVETVVIRSAILVPPPS